MYLHCHPTPRQPCRGDHYRTCPPEVKEQPARARISFTGKHSDFYVPARRKPFHCITLRVRADKARPPGSPRTNPSTRPALAKGRAPWLRLRSVAGSEGERHAYASVRMAPGVSPCCHVERSASAAETSGRGRKAPLVRGQISPRGLRPWSKGQGCWDLAA